MDIPDILPLFPLPEHVLLPGLPTPYRVFEPRYRALVDDLLARDEEQRWLALPRLMPGWRHGDQGSPPFLEVAAAAQVRHARALDTGDLLLVVEGRMRCRLEELPSSRPYRLARSTALPDLPDALSDGELAAGVEALLARVLTLAAQPAGAQLELLLRDPPPPVRLLDRLAAALLPAPDLRQAFLECRVASQRLAMLRTALGGDAGAPPARGWRPSEN
jgi:hypothetical protein